MTLPRNFYCTTLLMTLLLTAAACGSTPATQNGTSDAADDVGTDDAAIGDADAAVGTDASPDTAQVEIKEVNNGCVSDNECNDNDPCTQDVCGSDGKCTHDAATTCDDGDPCTTGDNCSSGSCAGTPGGCVDTVDTVDSVDSGDTGGGSDVVQTTNCSETEWKSTQNTQFVTDMGACGQSCIAKPSAQCVGDCITAKYNLSSTCGQCFTDLTTCVSSKCLNDCFSGATSAGCQQCAAKNCGKALGKCVGFPAPDCGADADCNDNNACTTDGCVNLSCGHTAVTCDDNNACTTDSCDKAKGCASVALPTSVTCNDGDVCTEGDNCGTGKCVGSAKNCDDSNPCTDDACTLAGECTWTNNASACNDSLGCTENDVCSGGTCAGMPNDATCSDGNVCTQDKCDLKFGCLSTANTETCDDGSFCTGGDHCVSGNCVGTLGEPCVSETKCVLVKCDPNGGNTKGEACKVLGTPNCDDGNSCTFDFCQEGFGCANDSNASLGKACNDGNPGTVEDECKAGGTCSGFVPACTENTQCTDDKACTNDVCDAYTCYHDPVPGTCQIGGACQLAGDVSATNVCLACEPTVSTSEFSAANDGATCETSGVCGNGKCYAPWPPSTPIAVGKTCQLPVCDTGLKLPFSSAGNWKITTKTTATTCNSIIAMVEPRANIGYTKTGGTHPLNFLGGCDYAAGGTSTQIGTFASNTEVTCEVKPQDYGVTSVETSVVSFQPGKGTGTAIATLYDLPSIAGQEGNTCTITTEVTVQHVPDCQFNADCDDNIACTNDMCISESGICNHALSADTCLIDGQCIANGDLQSSSGNGSCRFCVGKSPSQYGWTILSSGEPCNDGDGTTIQDKCSVGGQCSGTPE